MGQSIVIHGLIKKRAEIAGQHRAAIKAADAIKDDLAAIDRALLLCGYKDDPKGIAPRGKYKQLFGRNELKLTIINALRVAPADDETIAAQIMAAKGWGDDIHADVLKRVRDALQRAQTAGQVVQDFGPDGCLWTIAERATQPAETGS
ncbi:hypothetical protein P775_26715 [Puniceibacterium antarcticum]|uniref:Uncharacterized protein n=1 Tax=Puniceibacterium antarcticum TaxID=1206336 RepID=A0A2G8QYD8_9RHOB|nr:hypothetical protein [Puniceibacterium antarcticum]PIL14300.1 hypothetical protein P775_26715 [Puniceibacterium antarcticum]